MQRDGPDRDAVRAYSLVVITNGIPSAPQPVEIGTQDIFFQMEEATYGGGQGQAQINLSGTPAVFPLVLYVQAEGCTLARCGITGAASLSGPTNQPTVARPDPRITFTCAGQTAVEDLGNSGQGVVPGRDHLRQSDVFPRRREAGDDDHHSELHTGRQVGAGGASDHHAEAKLDFTHFWKRPHYINRLTKIVYFA